MNVYFHYYSKAQCDVLIESTDKGDYVYTKRDNDYILTSFIPNENTPDDFKLKGDFIEL